MSNMLGFKYNNRTYKYEEVGKSSWDYLDSRTKRGIMMAVTYAEQQAEIRDQHEHSKGYCVKCHMLNLPNGKCSGGCDD